MAAISLRRLIALSRKESYQIIRDPSSVVIAFVLPFLLLIIFGYGVNLDASAIRVGLLVEDRGAEAASLAATLAANVNLEVRPARSREELERWLIAGDVRGFVVLPGDFSRQLNRPGATAPVQVVTDGAEPNTANFVAAYVQGAWQSWTRQHALDHGASARALIEVIPRYWFNSAAVSRHYIVPGSIAVIMTIVGALLTSLVVAQRSDHD